MKKVIKIEGNKREVLKVKDFDQIIDFYPEDAWVNTYGIKKVFGKRGMIAVVYNDGMWAGGNCPASTSFQGQEWIGPVFIVRVSGYSHLHSLTRREVKEYINE